MKDHRFIDERSLAFDTLTVDKIERNPGLISKAQANIDRWLATCSPQVRPVLLEWQSLLAGPRDALLALLLGTDERAKRLRQSSPFAGALTPAERSKIILEYQRRESATA